MQRHERKAEIGTFSEAAVQLDQDRINTCKARMKGLKNLTLFQYVHNNKMGELKLRPSYEFRKNIFFGAGEYVN
jgi:hypothetical protein